MEAMWDLACSKLVCNHKKIGQAFHAGFITQKGNFKMLTRHLYRQEEVVAAFLWCLQKRRVEEGLFWLQELLDSELYDDVFKVMFKGWLWSFGSRQMGWFEAYYALYKKENVDEDEIMNLFYSLIRLPSAERDITVLGLLSLGVGFDLEVLPPTPKKDKVALNYHDTLQLAFIRYAALGKAKSAWTIAMQMYLNDASAAWEFFIGLGVPSQLRDAANEYDDADVRVASLAAAVGYLCIKGKRAPFQLVEMDAGTAKKRIEWKQMEGRRQRREYAIPTTCLAWITARGCVSYKKHTLGELRGLSLDTLRYRACPFWQSAVESVVDEDDTAVEAFWDTYFPDDQPDEWSLADQKKSHGPGVLAPGEEQSFSKHLRKWYTNSGSCIIWDCLKSVLRIFDSTTVNTNWSNGYNSMYEKRNLLHRRGKLAFKVVKIDGTEMTIVAVPVVVADDGSVDSDE